MILALQCLQEDTPGEKWQVLFNKTWPFYRHWFLSEGLMARKGYLSSSGALARFMPELVPLYEQLTALAGGGDLEARFLSMYCPPPYMTGCSQLAWNRDHRFLIRNYDYTPNSFEGAMWYTNWLRPVIGISDTNWGLLDGMNADGLAASLAFGGRSVVGEGFGIPLIIRYILETCRSTTEAITKLQGIPIHMAYNVTMIDAGGQYATVYLAPDKSPVILESPLSTNHQEQIDWPYYAALTETEERKMLLEQLCVAPHENEMSVRKKFLAPPLYSYHYEKNFGTLYSALYDVVEKKITLFWPEAKEITQRFTEFREDKIVLHLAPRKPRKNIYE